MEARPPFGFQLSLFNFQLNAIRDPQSNVPGAIGQLGTILGENGVNISRFYLGRHERVREALAVVEIYSALEERVLEKLREIDPVILVKQARL